MSRRNMLRGAAAGALPLSAAACAGDDGPPKLVAMTAKGKKATRFKQSEPVTLKATGLEAGEAYVLGILLYDSSHTTARLEATKSGTLEWVAGQLATGSFTATVKVAADREATVKASVTFTVVK